MGDDLHALSGVLLDPAAVEPQTSVGGGVAAAVLVGLFESPEGLRVVLTERRNDLRLHAGEISFPGGRRDPGESLRQTALREADEEIGLASDAIHLLGALAPVNTFVTGFTIYPFVAAIARPARWTLSACEVHRVLEPTLGAVRAGHERRQLQRGTVTLNTTAYVVDGNVIWGATARIIADLLARAAAALSGSPAPPDAPSI